MKSNGSARPTIQTPSYGKITLTEAVYADGKQSAKVPAHSAKIALSNAYINGRRKRLIEALLTLGQSAPLSIDARRVLGLVIHQTKVRDGELTAFETSVHHLWTKGLGHKTGPSVVKLVAVLNELLAKAWMVPYETPAGRIWRSMRWLDDVYVSEANGHLRLQLHQDMIPHIDPLKRDFTLVYLRALKNLQSPHTAAYYQFCCQFARYRDRSTHRVALSDLHEALELDYDSVYRQNWWQLWRDVLRPSAARINAETELCIHQRPLRVGGRVVAVALMVKVNRARLLAWKRADQGLTEGKPVPESRQLTLEPGHFG